MCPLSTIRCALFPPVQVFMLLCVLIALCFPFHVCLLCVCVVCSGVQVVVVCGCCDSVEGVGCVLHVVIVCSDRVIVRMCSV